MWYGNQIQGKVSWGRTLGIEAGDADGKEGTEERATNTISEEVQKQSEIQPKEAKEKRWQKGDIALSLCKE